MIFRSSQVEEAKRCVARAYYKYHLGLRASGAKEDIHLFFGKAVHSAIQITYESSLEDGIDYLQSLLWPVSRVKSKQVAISLLRQLYYKFDYKVIACEKEFSFPIDDDNWYGRYDMIAKKDGETVVVDFKTSNPYYLLTKPNDQFAAYYIGINQDEDVKKFIICNLDPNELNITFIPIRYTEKDVSSWLEEFRLWKDYYKSCINSGIIPRTNSCFDYGRKCEYHDICVSSEDIRPKVIKNCFIEDEKQKRMEW